MSLSLAERTEAFVTMNYYNTTTTTLYLLGLCHILAITKVLNSLNKCVGEDKKGAARSPKH